MQECCTVLNAFLLLSDCPLWGPKFSICCRVLAPLCKGSWTRSGLRDCPVCGVTRATIQAFQSLRHGCAVPPPFTQGRRWHESVGGGVLDAPQVWAIGILILAVRSCYFVGRGLDPSLLALLLLYLSQNTFYYKGYCYKGAYKCVVV